jgi:hypothetical protein
VPQLAPMPMMPEMPEQPKTPKLPRVPKVPMAPMPPEMYGEEMSAETYERTREAMERANEAMARSQEALERAQLGMLRDSDMVDLDNRTTRARITLERHRGAMDSARVTLERHRGAMDSASMMFERDGDHGAQRREEVYRFRTIDREKGKEGKIKVRTQNRVIVIDKAGGDIELGDAPDGAHVTTGGGAIIIGHSRGAVSAETGGGDIDLGDAEGAAEAMTGAGNVSINLVGEGAHPVNITSGKGDVELVLPSDANATLDLETAYTEHYGKHTKIKGDWSLDVTETQEWDSSHGTPRKYVRVKQKIGKGGPLIRIRTVNGDIRIKRGS